MRSACGAKGPQRSAGVGRGGECFDLPLHPGFCPGLNWGPFSGLAWTDLEGVDSFVWLKRG